MHIVCQISVVFYSDYVYSEPSPHIGGHYRHSDDLTRNFKLKEIQLSAQLNKVQHIGSFQFVGESDCHIPLGVDNFCAELLEYLALLGARGL